MFWRGEVAADFCSREGFRCGPLLVIFGSLQLLTSSHNRERDKALLRSVMVGAGMAFCLASLFPVVHRMVMVTFLENTPFLLLLRFAKILNFTVL